MFFIETNTGLLIYILIAIPVTVTGIKKTGKHLMWNTTLNYCCAGMDLQRKFENFDYNYNGHYKSNFATQICYFCCVWTCFLLSNSILLPQIKVFLSINFLFYFSVSRPFLFCSSSSIRLFKLSLSNYALNLI